MNYKSKASDWLIVALIISIFFFVYPFRTESQISLISKGDNDTISLFQITMQGLHLQSFQPTFGYKSWSPIINILVGFSVFIPLIIIIFHLFYSQPSAKFKIATCLCMMWLMIALIAILSITSLFGTSAYSNYPTDGLTGIIFWLIFGLFSGYLYINTVIPSTTGN